MANRACGAFCLAFTDADKVVSAHQVRVVSSVGRAGDS